MSHTSPKLEELAADHRELVTLNRQIEKHRNPPADLVERRDALRTSLDERTANLSDYELGRVMAKSAKRKVRL